MRIARFARYHLLSRQVSSLSFTICEPFQSAVVHMKIHMTDIFTARTWSKAGTLPAVVLLI
jgi:hypothetical protein